jgi:hypothetical protein
VVGLRERPVRRLFHFLRIGVAIELFLAPHRRGSNLFPCMEDTVKYLRSYSNEQ